MLIAARNWIAEASSVSWDTSGVVTGDIEALRRGYVGEPIAFTGAWIAFNLGASRRIRCVAAPGVVDNAGVGAAIDFTVRSGGAGGTVVASSSVGIYFESRLQALQSLPVQQSLDVTGDYIRFDFLFFGSSRILIPRLWASDTLTLRRTKVTPSLLDNSSGERSDGGVFYGTERRRRRQLRIDVEAASSEDALIRLASTNAIDSVLKIAARFGNVGELLAIDPDLGQWWKFHGHFAARPSIDRVAGAINRASLVLREF